MARITYEKHKFSDKNRLVVERADEILEQYSEQGYRLTLRQLYYRFVANNWLPNDDQSYNRLKDIMTRARVAGLINWDHLTDRNRNLRQNSHWEDPQDILNGCVRGYGIDLWSDQPERIEVFCEKDALVDVIGTACEPWDVGYMACKGYASTTMLWEAAHNRYLQWSTDSQQDIILLYLGDHDPSGIQMCEDVEKRLKLFSRGYIRKQDDKQFIQPNIEVRRVALNLNQIEKYDPPPQPVKKADPRHKRYVEEFGIDESWELDALEPAVIVDLINDAIGDIVVASRWKARRKLQEKQRKKLKYVADNWADITGG